MYSVWDKEHANELSREYSRRAQFFWNVYQLVNEDGEFEYEQWHLDAYVEHADFIRFMESVPAGHDAHEMGLFIRSLVPEN